MTLLYQVFRLLKISLFQPLFTHVRRPGEGNGKPTGSFDGFYISHDMRHAMPWSLLNKNPVRESSISDININRKGPKSADAKRDLDDRRLKELLEELYTDKKYFDHVIHTTGTDSCSIGKSSLSCILQSFYRIMVA